MNCRSFFSAIAAVAAGAVLDPERALWVPGKKLISIPTRLVSAVDLGSDQFTVVAFYTQRRGKTWALEQWMKKGNRVFLNGDLTPYVEMPFVVLKPLELRWPPPFPRTSGD